MSTLSQVRRALWRGSAISGNAQAVMRSVEQGSPVPLLQREGRRVVTRSTQRTARKLTRFLGW